jgi:hypothetical protein
MVQTTYQRVRKALAWLSPLTAFQVVGWAFMSWLLLHDSNTILGARLEMCALRQAGNINLCSAQLNHAAARYLWGYGHSYQWHARGLDRTSNYITRHVSPVSFVTGRSLYRILRCSSSSLLATLEHKGGRRRLRAGQHSSDYCGSYISLNTNTSTRIKYLQFPCDGTRPSFAFLHARIARTMPQSPQEFCPPHPSSQAQDHCCKHSTHQYPLRAAP